MHRRSEHAVNAQLAEEQAHAHHIRHGVQRADLMKMDLGHGLAVHMALRPGDEAVDGLCIRAHPLGQRQAVDQARDIGKPPRGVVMVVRGGRGLVLLRAEHGHRNVRAQHAAFFRALRLHPHAGQAERVHAPEKALRVGMELEQRRHEHIARRAHVAFQIECFHALFSVRWLMRLA